MKQSNKIDQPDPSNDSNPNKEADVIALLKKNPQVLANILKSMVKTSAITKLEEEETVSDSEESEMSVERIM